MYGHENKCGHLHGHNYVALITCSADELDPINRVIDFSVIKERIGGWIEDHWDHRMILFVDDPLAEQLDLHDPGIFIAQFNPTAEAMARHLCMLIGPDVLPQNIRIDRVRIWETENCYADCRNVSQALPNQ